MTSLAGDGGFGKRCTPYTTSVDHRNFNRYEGTTATSAHRMNSSSVKSVHAEIIRRGARQASARGQAAGATSAS